MPSLLEAFVRDALADSVIEPEVARREVWIAIRADGHDGTGSADDPRDGSGTNFDNIMAGLQGQGGGHQTVHLGPGNFLTQGSFRGGWIPQSGQRILGSGVFVTTLKLQLSAATAGFKYTVFEQSDYQVVLEGYEITDLTFDCNMAGQPNTGQDGYSRIAVGAVLLRGRDILVRRVRVVNFGTQTAANECFPISVAVAIDPDVNPRPVNCILEDCIVEQPALNNARETTCLNLSGGEKYVGGQPQKMDYHEDCVIRNCYVNCEYVRAEPNKPPLMVKALTYATESENYVATLETYEDHAREEDDWIVVSGALRNGVWNNPFNGSFQVLEVTAKTLKYQLAGNPGGNPDTVANVWLGKAPNDYVSIEEVTYANGVATVRTTSPHFRWPGDRVLITDVEGLATNPYNGYRQVSSVLDAKRFTFETTPPSQGTPVVVRANVGVAFQALSGGGIRTVVERNRVFNCRVGYYKDSWNTKSVLIRKNYFYNVYKGIYFHMGATDVSSISGCISFQDPHYQFTKGSGTQPYEVGDVVKLTGSNLPKSYVMVVALGGATFDFESPTFAPDGTYYALRVFHLDRVLIEDNVIEMGFYAPSYGANNRAPPGGIDVTASSPTNPIEDPWIFQNVIVRRNLIRHVGGGVDPCYRGDSRGVDVSSCKSLIVESNLIGVEGANWAVRAYYSGKVKAFNNLTLAGEPRYALKWDIEPNVHTPEIRTQAEELFLGRL